MELILQHVKEDNYMLTLDIHLRPHRELFVLATVYRRVSHVL